MANLLLGARAQFFDANGDPLSLGKVYTYEAGTTTPKVTYTTSVGDVANANPVVLDAEGRAAIWLGTGTAYRIIVKDSAGSTITDDDGITAAGSSFVPDGIVGDGSTDNSVALQAAFNNLASIVSVNRRTRIYLPRGKYLFSTPLTINQADSGDVHGRIIIEGEGQINTELVCTASSGDALTITGGRVTMRDLTIGAAGARTSGSGSGIVIDSGNTTPSVDQFNFDGVAVQNQPDDGWEIRNGERVQMRSCVADTCGRHGFHFYDNTIGGISNLLLACRAYYCAGNGLRMDLTSESTAINFQAIGCGSASFPAGIWSNSRGLVLINPDVEGKEKAPGNSESVTGLRGADVVGGTIIGGVFSGLEYGIYCATEAWPLVLEYPHFTNATYPSPMSRGVLLSTVSPISTARIRLKTSYTDVTKPIDDAVYINGAEIIVGANRSGAYIEGAGAPAADANWIGQLYQDTTPGSLYIAIQTGSGAGDWVAIT